MTEKTYMNAEMDRTDWGPGPWDGEPDKVSWTDEETGLPCIALRAHPEQGNWCGYVAVEPGHPLHGHDYSDTDLEVHGGLTFAAGCRDDEPVESSVCHIPEPGKSGEVWWFGFDCGHWNDIAPGMAAMLRKLGAGMPVRELNGIPFSMYRPLGYVKSECAHLARQLKEAEGRGD